MGKSIIIIGAFPPPVSGQSLAAQLLRDGLTDHGYQVFSLNFGESVGGDPLLRRICQLAGVELNLLYRCIRERGCIVYLQLGHGRVALVRDLFFMATAFLTRHPCITHVHGSGFRKAFDSLPQPVRIIEKFLIKRLKAAVVLSESLRAMFEGLLEDARIIAVDNGIDPAFVSLTDENSARQPSNDHLNILFLSNFLTAKGFSTLLRAAVLAKEKNRNYRFRFVGARIEGQDVDIDDFVREYGLQNVIVDDVLTGVAKHEAYQWADVFVLPSVYEGQPLCILEAMFESLPIITTRVGGIPEIFSTDPECAVYVEPNAPELLLEAFDRLYESPEMRMDLGARGRQIADLRFRPERHIQQMMEILEQ